MPTGDLLAAKHARDHLCQIAGAFKRPLAPTRHDGARNGARATLFAQMIEDIGKISSPAELTTSPAVVPAPDMRMSSGPSP